MQETKILLTEKDIPRQWYNITVDMPNPPKPPLHPGTQQPVGPDDLKAIFPMALIEQEVSAQRWIDIPGRGARNIYSLEARAALQGKEARGLSENPGKNILQV